MRSVLSDALVQQFGLFHDSPPSVYEIVVQVCGIRRPGSSPMDREEHGATSQERLVIPPEGV